MTQSFPGELESPASPQRKRNDGEREVARKNAAIGKCETSTFFSLSSYTCLEENQWKDYLIPILGQRRATRRYMRRSGSLTLQTGVKEWLDGGKKACTGPGLVHLGDPNQVRMGRQSAQLTDAANFGSNSAPYTGPVFSLCSSSVYIIILRSFTQMLCIHFLINTVRA